MRLDFSKLNRQVRQWSYQPPFPVVLQSDESECGLACLAMLFSALGRPTRLEDLRKDYGSTRGGETIGELCQFAERHGFRAIPSRCSEIDVKRLPCILFVRGDHFSVLWKVQKNHFAVADPSDGCLLLNAEQFEDYFSGIVLTLRPIPNFIKSQMVMTGDVEQKQASLLPLSSDVVVPVIVMAIIIAVLTLATASLQDVFMTYVVEEAEILWTRGLVNLTVSFAIVLAAASFVLQMILQRFLQINILRWNIKLFNSLFDAPYSFFVNKTTGLIASRFNQVDEALAGFQSAAVTALLGFLNLLIFLIAILMVSLPLALVSAIGMAGFIFIGIKFFGYNLQSNYIKRQADCEVSEAEFKLISGREQIIIEKNQPSMMRELATSYLNQGIAELTINRLANWNEFWLSAVDLMLNTLLLVVSALLIISGKLSTGTYAAVSVIIGTALQPIRSLAQIIETLQSSRLSFDTANELLQPKNDINSISASPRDDQPALELDNVSFKYSLYGQKIHNRVALRLKSTNTMPITVRLDGGTGTGKSTLLYLILGMLSPSEGKVLIKGVEVHSIPRSERNKIVQLVDRNPFIITDTVLNNALLGTGSSLKNLEHCLISLGLNSDPLFREQSHRFIKDSTSLSTGQSVMIGIVRAVLKKPQLLLLDEALTSLPEEMHLPILKGIKSTGINVLLVQHGTSKALAKVPTINIATIQAA